MSDWDQLYESVLGVESSRAADEARRRAALEEQARFERWSERATSEAMDALARAVAFRSVELEQRTGKTVVASYPSRPPIDARPDGPMMTFLGLRSGNAEVHVYSHRSQGGLPHLHLAYAEAPHVARGASVSRHSRLRTMPGCIIRPATSDGWQLWSLPAPEGGASAPLSFEAFVHRAFEVTLLWASPSRAVYGAGQSTGLVSTTRSSIQTSSGDTMSWKLQAPT